MITTTTNSSSSSPSSYTAIFGQVAFYLVAGRLLFAWLLKPLYQWWWRWAQPPASAIWRPSPTNWAVVTGGTDGIGLEYARQLGALGYPLIIISRSPEKLATVRAAIERTVPACPAVRTIAFDFSLNSTEHYGELEKQLSVIAGPDTGHRIDVLVNNVGISFSTPEYFTVIAAKLPGLMGAMINVNVVAAVKMTAFVWSRMLEENRGVVLNIGSQSALDPIPLLALYSASKAYLDYFTHTLALEAAHKPGVIVQSVLPGFVSTKMSHLRVAFNVPTAGDFVRAALARVGRSERTFGYWWHSVIGAQYALWAHLFGSNFNSFIAYWVLSGYRARYYRVKALEDPYREFAGGLGQRLKSLTIW